MLRGMSDCRRRFVCAKRDKHNTERANSFLLSNMAFAQIHRFQGQLNSLCYFTTNYDC